MLRRTTTRTAVAATAAAMALAGLTACGAGGPDKADASTLGQQIKDGIAKLKASGALVKIANKMLPIFVEHSLWRPKARASIAGLMRERDIKMLRDDLEQGVRLAGSLGLDVSDLEMPSFS